VGYSSIVSIKCDYPDCEIADEFFDSAGAEHEYLPVGWVRLEFLTDVEHEDHHDPVGLSALLCPNHGSQVREQLWRGKEPESNPHR
jgi:hypothetical protein